MSHRAYSGRRLRTGDTTVIVIPKHPDTEAYPLPLRLDVRSHSPTGFEWGYSGSGPSQLALALLCDALKDDYPGAAADALAQHHYQHFKRDRVVLWQQEDDWWLSQGEILAWVKGAEQTRQAVAHGHHHGGMIIEAAMAEGRAYIGMSVRADETLDHCFNGNLSHYGSFFRCLVDHAERYAEEDPHPCPICDAHIASLRLAREAFLANMRAALGDERN